MAFLGSFTHSRKYIFSSADVNTINIQHAPALLFMFMHVFLACCVYVLFKSSTECKTLGMSQNSCQLLVPRVYNKEGGRVSYSSIVPGTAVVRVQTRSMIFTTCGVSPFTLRARTCTAVQHVHALLNRWKPYTHKACHTLLPTMTYHTL